MSSRKKRDINLPAPYLKRLWLDPARVPDREAYPFCLPFLQDDFSLTFDRAVTIIVGENGTGKSTLLEGIAELAGYDGAGGGKGYMPVDHSRAEEVMGRTARELAAEDHQRLVLPRRELFLGRPISRRSRARCRTTRAGFSLAFPRRRLYALLRRTLSAAGHLHLR
jgi:energy-coupling factor transporter ATP-binding protein EcfA2